MNQNVDGRPQPRGISLADQDEAQLSGSMSILCEVTAHRSPRSAPVLENVSHSLAHAAGRVERLRVPRRDERDLTSVENR